MLCAKHDVEIRGSRSIAWLATGLQSHNRWRNCCYDVTLASSSHSSREHPENCCKYGKLHVNRAGHRPHTDPRAVEIIPVVNDDIFAASAASSASRWLLVRKGCELPVSDCARLTGVLSTFALPLARATGSGLVYTMADDGCTAKVPR